MAVDSVAANAAPQITGAIRQAARSTGISFEYLLTTAQIESNLNPAAQASTSSAKGLYQFIEQTWLGTMKSERAGARAMAAMPTPFPARPDGRYEVADPAMRAAIMQLRSDPAASAMMAGAFTRTNAAQLRGAIGRQPTEGELYIAHFLGPDGAGKLIGAAMTQPRANAADDVSAGRGGQPEHLLRPLGPPAQRRRGLCQADRPLRDRARGSPARAATASAGRSLRAPTALPPPSPDRTRRACAAVTRHRRRHAGLRAGQTTCRRCRTPSRCSRRCSPTARAGR